MFLLEDELRQLTGRRRGHVKRKQRQPWALSTGCVLTNISSYYANMSSKHRGWKLATENSMK
ncbi:hypothetical protein PATSB16_05230 [Pandoraea thiooxydans]|nr:hypothetical protein PATSB16_05230 [Pandoraea thiooxydans]